MLQSGYRFCQQLVSNTEMARRKAERVAYPLTVNSFQSHHQGCSPCVVWGYGAPSCKGRTYSGSVGPRIRQNDKESSRRKKVKAQHLLSPTVCSGMQWDAPLQISSPFAHHKAWSSAKQGKNAGEKSTTSGSFSRAEVHSSGASCRVALQLFLCIFGFSAGSFPKTVPEGSLDPLPK